MPDVSNFHIRYTDSDLQEAALTREVVMNKTFFRFFHSIRDIFVSLYRLTHGKVGGHVQGLQVLLLTTVGRQTGQQRTTPLGYFMEDDNYIVTASNAGFDTHPAWFHNLRANQIGRAHV